MGFSYVKICCTDWMRARHIGQRGPSRRDTMRPQGPQTQRWPHGRNAWSRRARRQTQQGGPAKSSSSVSESIGLAGAGAATGGAGAASSPSEAAGAAGAGAATGGAGAGAATGAGAGAATGGGGGGFRGTKPVMRRCCGSPATTSRRTPNAPPAKFRVV